MLIGIDIDGVICNLAPVVCININKKYGTHLTPGDIYEWDSVWVATDGRKIELKKEVREVLKDYEIASVADIISGALEGVTEITMMGHEVVFVTARKDSKESLENTRAWMDRYFPDIPIIHVDHKESLQQLDVLIDDKFANALSFAETKRHCVLLTQPWNEKKEITTEYIVRAKDWNEILQLIYTIKNWKDMKNYRKKTSAW